MASDWYTIKYVIDKIKERKPATIKIITFLSKDGNRKVDLKPNYTCFSIPDKFIIVFGLDYKGKYRNYVFVGVLKKEFLDLGKNMKNTLQIKRRFNLERNDSSINYWEDS